MSFGVVILACTAVWHALATWHFTFFPARTLARATSERPVNVVATELFRFLGAMNLAFVVLGATAILAGPEARRLAYLTLVMANLSQLVIDVRVQRLGLARGAFFLQILAGDALFAALNGVALALASV